MNNTVYDNDNYKVVRVSDGVDALPYHVINKKTDTVESKVEALPQALIFAEQFNAMLIKEYHKTIIEQQFGTGFAEYNFDDTADLGNESTH